MIRRTCRAAALVVALVGCTPAAEEEKVSPYPGLTVTGHVLSVRAALPVEGVHVLVWNEYDTGSAYTDAAGAFTLTVDGSDSPSYLRISDPGYRPYETTVTVSASSHAVGTHLIVSKDEVLFSTYPAGEIYMIRVGGGNASIIQLTTSADAELSPCRDESGLTMRWLDATTRQVMEGPWSAASATPIWTAPGTDAVLSMSWSPRATFVWTNDGSADAVVMAGEPSGAPNGFSYDWAGTQPDASPAAFGYLGPQPIDGNMLAFAKGDGIYTAFPYFMDSFLVPEKISSTTNGDGFPAWSPLRADGTLDLAFQRTNDVYVSRVTADTVNKRNVWGAATAIFGTAAGDPNITDVAWAPETEGADDRLVLLVHPIVAGGDGTYEAGDLIVVTWNHATGAVSGPTLLYDASGTGNVGRAGQVSWR